MVSTPSWWLTTSGWPLMLVTSRPGVSPVARMATEPANVRTRRAVTSSKARRVGASTVHCGIGFLLSHQHSGSPARLLATTSLARFTIYLVFA